MVVAGATETNEVACNGSDDPEKKRVKSTIGSEANEGNWNKDESGELRETTVMGIKRRKFLAVQGFRNVKCRKSIK